MELAQFITVIVALATACSAGFLFLLRRIDVNGSMLEKDISAMKKEIDSKTDYKYVNDDFVRKEMFKLHFEKIESSIKEIKESQVKSLEILDELRFHESEKRNKENK